MLSEDEPVKDLRGQSGRRFPISEMMILTTIIETLGPEDWTEITSRFCFETKTTRTSHEIEKHWKSMLKNAGRQRTARDPDLRKLAQRVDAIRLQLKRSKTRMTRTLVEGEGKDSSSAEAAAQSELRVRDLLDLDVVATPCNSPVSVLTEQSEAVPPNTVSAVPKQCQTPMVDDVVVVNQSDTVMSAMTCPVCTDSEKGWERWWQLWDIPNSVVWSCCVCLETCW
eukprot:c10048_g3_i2.p1 GENE.c10048_g3_i2~~c10048_g3_i2.p1  ORF type:complete len:225 (-),score=41.62 c10048_g3_i2:11-685(-)